MPRSGRQIITDLGQMPATAIGTLTGRLLGSWLGDTLNVKAFGAKGDGVTDDTAAINAAIAQAQTNGGGTIFFPVGTYLILGQLALPFTGTPPIQKPMRFLGVGTHFTGGTIALGPNGPNGGSILDLRYSGLYGRIFTLGHGLLEMTGLTIRDVGGLSTTAFIYTTNTTLHIHDCSFFGNGSGQTCSVDGIVLGGTVAAFGNADPTHGFQGYGTIIRDNYFDYIRRAVYGQTYANAVVIQGNTIWANSGNSAGGAAIEFNGNVTDQDTGNIIRDNLFELQAYPYAIKLNNAFGNLVVGNGFFDTTGTSLAGVYLGAAGGNVLIPGMKVNTLPFVAGPGYTTAGANNVVYGPYNRLDVGGARPDADGESLRVYAGTVNDHCYLTMFPRSATPTLRGGYLGYAGGPATTQLYLKNEIGALWLDSMAATNIAAFKPFSVPETVGAPATGQITVDANTGQNFEYDLATAAGAWNVVMSGGYGSAFVTITFRNTSAGAVTVTWPANVHLAGAWVNPGAGNNRSITLRKEPNLGASWYEVSRTAADVVN